MRTHLAVGCGGHSGKEEWIQAQEMMDNSQVVALFDILSQERSLHSKNCHSCLEVLPHAGMRGGVLTDDGSWMKRNNPCVWQPLLVTFGNSILFLQVYLKMFVHMVWQQFCGLVYMPIWLQPHGQVYMRG